LILLAAQASLETEQHITALSAGTSAGLRAEPDRRSIPFITYFTTPFLQLAKD
jgi:hypothetical protein